MQPEGPKQVYIAAPPQKPRRSIIPKGTVGSMIKAVLFVIFLVVIAILVMLGLMATSLDTEIFKLTAAGTITDTNNQPVSGARVSFGEDFVTTDDEGKFSIDNLDLRTYEVNITRVGYETLITEVEMTRGFLNYLNSFDFAIQKSGIGSISGQIVADIPDYDFGLDLLYLDDQIVEVETDGSFNINEAETGSKVLRYESDRYIDFEKTFRLEIGNNPRLADIELEPAGDIFGNLTSYVRQDIVADLEIIVEGVSGNQIVVEENGDFRIRDLEIGREYTVRTRKQGYESRDYTVVVDQGVNPIANFVVVENGTVPFLYFDAEDELQVFVSDFDGLNRTQLTFEEDMNPAAEYIDNTIIYYLSDRDGIRSDIAGDSLLVYAVSTEGGNAQRITTNWDNLGRVVPNFAARKLANVSVGFDEDERDRRLEVISLTGQDRQEIDYLFPGNVLNDIRISDNGAFIFYVVEDIAERNTGLYRGNTQTGESSVVTAKQGVQIYDVSRDGDRVLYSAPNEDNNLVGLYLFTISSGQDKRILPNVAARSQFQFVKGSKQRVIFQAFQNNANNIYEVNVDTEDEVKLTNFRGTEGIEAVYQQAGYILYQTNRGLYIMDPAKPVSGVLVTKLFARYTGYDF